MSIDIPDTIVRAAIAQADQIDTVGELVDGLASVPRTAGVYIAITGPDGEQAVVPVRAAAVAASHRAGIILVPVTT